MQRVNKLFYIGLVIMVIVGGYAFEVKAQGLGYIQGTVRDTGTGDPIPGIYVDAFEVNFGYVSTGSVNTTDSNGQYSLMVFTDGIYKVFFRGLSNNYVGQWWNSASSFSGANPVTGAGGNTVTDFVGGTPVTVISGNTVTDINATMTTTGGGQISGRVTGPNDAGVPFVSVSVYDYGQKIDGKRGIASASPDSNGDYIISNLPPGTYKLLFRDASSVSNNLNEWWDNHTGFSTADPVPVTAGTATSANCMLSEGGIISGTVRDESNNPINGAIISAYDQNQKQVSSAATDAGGIYSLKRLPSGNYKLLFKGPSGSNLAYQWYGNQSTFNQADWVPVTAGITQADMNAQLIPGGTITGTTTPGSTSVIVFDEYQNIVANAFSATDGAFSVAGIPSGRYKISFSKYNYGRTWFNDRRTFESADWIWVNAPNSTPGVNCQLISSAIISGKITDATGTGIPRVKVQVYDDATLEALYGSATTNSLGNYSLSSVPPGSGRLFFDSRGTGYFPEWWDDKKTISDATPINLISGETYPGRSLMRWKQLFTPTASLEPDEAKSFIAAHAEGSYTLLDVRQPGEYEKEHLPGAILIPLPDLADAFSRLDPSKPIIIY